MCHVTATNADLIISGVNMVDDDGRIIETWSLDPAKEWNKYRITAPWGRLFRKISFWRIL